MEENYDYKQDIRSTRKGCLGSSDGKLLKSVDENGFVLKAHYKRMAVCKGLIEQTEIPANSAIKAGDYIELAIFEHLKEQNPLCESNPLVVSNKYVGNNVKLIDHPDIRIVNPQKKLVTYIEVKTTKFTFEQTRAEYTDQLFIHTIMANEEASMRGKDWKSQVILAHYLTDGLDLDKGIEFDPSRLTFKRVFVSRNRMNIKNALAIVDKFLEGFTEYYEGDVIDAEYLPAEVKEQMQRMADVLNEIDARKAQLEEFKKKLFDFMLKREIKSIKNDYFSFVRVDETKSTTFDSKSYCEDLIKKYPRKALKIIKEYSRISTKRGYVKIEVKKRKTNE